MVPGTAAVPQGMYTYLIILTWGMRSVSPYPVVAIAQRTRSLTMASLAGHGLMWSLVVSSNIMKKVNFFIMSTI